MLFFDEGHIKYPEYYLLTTEEGKTISSVITMFWATQPKPEELTDEDLLAQQHIAAFIEALKDKNVSIDYVRDLCVKICASDIWTVAPPEEFILDTGETAPYECIIETLDARFRGKKFVPGLNGAPDLKDIPSLYAFLNIPEGRKYVPYAEYFMAQDFIFFLPKRKTTEDIITPMDLQLFAGEVEGKKPIRHRRSKAERIAQYSGETHIGWFGGDDAFLFLPGAKHEEIAVDGGNTVYEVYTCHYADKRTRQIIVPKDTYTSIGNQTITAITLDKMTQQINHAIRNDLTEHRESGNYLTIKLTEFMAFRGLTDRKSARPKFTAAICALCESVFKEEEAADGKRKPKTITRIASLVDREEQRYKEFSYCIAIDPAFYENAASPRTLFLPNSLMKIQNGNTYLIGRRIWTHTGQNFTPGEMTKISVSTLLRVCSFKHPQDLRRPSDAGQKIIKPFEKCIEELEENGVFASCEYRKPNGVMLTDEELEAMHNDYTLFSSLVLYCTLPQKQEAEYTEAAKKRKPAQGEGTKTTGKGRSRRTGGKGA